MNTGDLPSGPKPVETTRFRASRQGDLVPFLDRLKDQQFRFADLKYRKEEKAVDLLVERIHPPDRGTWALRIAGVESWLVEHRANHETDTIKDIRIVVANETRRVVVRCVLDQWTAVVKAVDLRLVRIGEDRPAAVRYEDLPGWFREEVQERFNEQTREEQRIEKVRTDIRWAAFAGGSVVPLLVGMFTGGGLLLFVTCPLLGGGAAWLVARMRWGHLAAGAVYGGGASAACFAAGAGNIFSMFYIPFFLICVGMAMGHWLRLEEDMRV